MDYVVHLFLSDLILSTSSFGHGSIPVFDGAPVPRRFKMPMLGPDIWHSMA